MCYLCANNFIIENGQLFNNFKYQCYSDSSLIAQIFVRLNILCAAECINNPNCRTTTYNKLNQSCLMYTESSTLGQLISNNNTIIFESQVPRSCANWTVQSNVDYPGGDIAELVGLTLNECRQWCNLTVNCIGFSYSNVDIPCQLNSNIESINGYEQEQLLSLEEACQPLHNILGTELQLYVTIAKLNSKQPKHELTPDESASIYLYTMEWNQPENSLHVLLNQALVAIDRKQLQYWYKYLKLFFTALFKLPYAEYHTVWRGVPKDVTEYYREGDEITWWSLTSATSSFNILQSPMYLGREKVQTIFQIKTRNGKSIREHSHLESEEEILLLPGIVLKVMGTSKQGVGIHIVHLHEVPLYDDQQMNETSSSITNNQLDEYRNPQLEQIIRLSEPPAALGMESMNLNDRDMEIVVRLGIVEKERTGVNLSHNGITSVGASLLGQSFYNMKYIGELKLCGNRLLDAGVQCIARGLANKELGLIGLYLDLVGMTDASCEYLVEAVRINGRIRLLYLFDNKISDYGVQVLMEILKFDQRGGIPGLGLSENKLTTDASVDRICSAMFTYPEFRKIHLRNCSLSMAAIGRLQLAVQQRGSFSLYV
ncbi:unnamed protein product [Adineta steineri]|uniref:NAD(P)(+)--arginine ADP-ribosyltransferase n=1 Tax=Adineta steineri TaxID=433720 RepID=A0A815SNU1_9BILA|nr:unnamed protein product [Adineta steineri]CAF1641567.1 unnamed protein product [Adineta steineri]